MTDMKEQAFIDYWGEIETLLEARYALSTIDAGITPEDMANAQDSGWSGEDFVAWFAAKYDLTPFGSKIDNMTKTRIT